MITWLGLTLVVFAGVYLALMAYQVSWRVIDRERDEPDGEQEAQAFLEQQAQSNHGQAVEKLRREGEEAMLKSAKPLTGWAEQGQAWLYDSRHASASTETAAIPVQDA